MEIQFKKSLSYLSLIAAFFLLPLNTAMARSTTEVCPYSSTGQCTAWLSELDDAFQFSNIRYWPYRNNIDPWGVLSLEVKSLSGQNKVHVFKDSRSEQNTFDTTFIDTYSKLTEKGAKNTRRSRMEFIIHAHGHDIHVMLKSESEIPKPMSWYPPEEPGEWYISENCITINGIEDCYKIKNKNWRW